MKSDETARGDQLHGFGDEEASDRVANSAPEYDVVGPFGFTSYRHFDYEGTSYWRSQEGRICSYGFNGDRITERQARGIEAFRVEEVKYAALYPMPTHFGLVGTAILNGRKMQVFSYLISGAACLIRHYVCIDTETGDCPVLLPHEIHEANFVPLRPTDERSATQPSGGVA